MDGYIDGRAAQQLTSGESRLYAMESIVTTKAGRDLLKPVVQPAAMGISNLHIHGPVGAIGHQSTGTVSINQQWIAAAPEPDWSAVAEAFKQAITNKVKSASSSEDFSTVAALARVEEEATQKNKTALMRWSAACSLIPSQGRLGAS